MKRNAQKDITRCICDFNPGIGAFICCDKCSVWQHMRCMGVHPSRVPQIYECELCDPRPVDKEAAVQLQLLLRDEESTDSDAESPARHIQERKTNAKRLRKPSSNSAKSEGSPNNNSDRTGYKDVKENIYSHSIKHRLETRTEGQPSFGNSPPSVSRVQPQAGSSLPASSSSPATLHVMNQGPVKMVVTRHNIRPGNYITDFKGHFKLLSEMNDGGKDTLTKRPLNFVLHYPQLNICIDTREYGNISRFVRRSCNPNANVRSYLKEGKLHIGIYAKEHISSNSEITIPFNFPITEYQVVLHCPCSSSSCLVQKHNEGLTKRPFQRTESCDSMNSDDETRKQKLTREEVKMQSYIQAIEKRERDEERKRVLSENLKSPIRDSNEETSGNTPSRGKSRRRKGSGKKVRKGSSSSLTNNTTINTKSPEHFTFDPGVENSNNCSPEVSPQVRINYGPAYNIVDPVMSSHHVKYNGCEHDIQLRPINTTPFSRLRRDFKLKTTNTLTPIKMQKDGFIIPVHGSFLSPKVRSILPYKTSKKRWLETYIKEGVFTTRSPTQSPSHNPPPQVSPAKDPSPSPPSMPAAAAVVVPNVTAEEDSLAVATSTLQLTDPVPEETPDTEVTNPLPPEEPVQQSISPPIAEKKKRVSLADYKKRLQSRSSKASTLSSEGACESKSDKENSPRPMCPVFEPISPEDSEKIAPQPSLLEEFSRPSLSETISVDALNPRKIRKIEFPESAVEKIAGNNLLSDASSLLSKQVALDSDTTLSSESCFPLSADVPPIHINGASKHTVPNSPSRLSDDTFSKIKEILSQSSSNNSNGLSLPLVRMDHSVYDPNAMNKYPGYSSQCSESRDTKRLKSSNSDCASKYYKDSDQR